MQSRGSKISPPLLYRRSSAAIRGFKTSPFNPCRFQHYSHTFWGVETWLLSTAIHFIKPVLPSPKVLATDRTLGMRWTDSWDLDLRNTQQPIEISLDIQVRLMFHLLKFIEPLSFTKPKYCGSKSNNTISQHSCMIFKTWSSAKHRYLSAFEQRKLARSNQTQPDLAGIHSTKHWTGTTAISTLTPSYIGDLNTDSNSTQH